MFNEHFLHAKAGNSSRIRAVTFLAPFCLLWIIEASFIGLQKLYWKQTRTRAQAISFYNFFSLQIIQRGQSLVAKSLKRELPPD